MSHPALLPGIVAVALFLLCGLGYLVRAGIRTRKIGTCWHCGAEKVRSSRPHAFDSLAAAFLLKPYRCTGCLTRFYGFRRFPAAPTPRVAPEPTVPIPVTIPKRPFPIRVKVIVRLSWPNTWEDAWDLLLAKEEGIH